MKYFEWKIILVYDFPYYKNYHVFFSINLKLIGYLYLTNQTERLNEILTVDKALWKDEADGIEEFYMQSVRGR